MDWTVLESKRHGCAFGNLNCHREDPVGQTGWRNEHRFFKRGPLRSVWLVKYGGNGQTSIIEEPVDAQFASRYVLLNKDRFVIRPFSFSKDLSNLHCSGH